MWRQGSWLAAAVLCLAILAIVDDAEAGRKKGERKANRRQAQEQADIDAGWVFEECVPRRGTCGRGTKTGTLQGETKTRKCKVPCPEGEEGARGGRRRGGRKQGCRYTKGDWSECVNGERTLSMTLSPRSDQTTCEASKTISRPCATKKGKAKCFYGKWTKFGECTNGVKTKTRPIIDGGERCQKKAVKTKSC